MRRTRLFVDVEPSAAVVQLSAKRTHYLTRVLRHSEGDPIDVLDGRGNVGRGSLQHSNRGHWIAIDEWSYKEDTESSLDTTLGLVLLRGQRLDYALQKSTELGVTRIHLLTSARCEVNLRGQRLASRLGHAREVTIAALEQSGRTCLPELREPAPLEEWLEGASADLRWLLHPAGGDPSAPGTRPASAALLSGPEGGFTGDEVRLATRAGFDAVRLGPRTLRAETAPVAALALVQACCGDLR